MLSKGHGAIGLYAVLAERGFFPVEELETYGRPGSRLMGHPVARGARRGDAHRLARPRAGAGQRLRPGRPRPAACFVVLGDGELQEGSVWEAAMSSSDLGLDNLTAIIDRNGLQITGLDRGHGRASSRSPSAGARSAGPYARWTATTREPCGRRSTAREPGRPTVRDRAHRQGPGAAVRRGPRESHYATLSERQHTRALAVLRRPRRGSAGAGNRMTHAAARGRLPRPAGRADGRRRPRLSASTATPGCSPGPTSARPRTGTSTSASPSTT